MTSSHDCVSDSVAVVKVGLDMYAAGIGLSDANGML